MKRQRMTGAALAAASLLVPSGAAAAEPLQPLQPWTVDYGETACTARTRYGSPDQPTSLSFRLSPGGKSLQMMVLRPGPGLDPMHRPATVRFADQSQAVSALRYSTADRKVQVVSVILPRMVMDPLRAAPAVLLSVPESFEEAFALPRIDAVFRQLERCQADLQAHWNLDEAASATLKARAEQIASPAARVTSDDYPIQSVRAGETGRVGVTLLIGADGLIKDCMVEESSGVASLDAMSCIVLRRARFTPARDANDRPARSAITTSLTWSLADF